MRSPQIRLCRLSGASQEVTGKLKSLGQAKNGLAHRAAAWRSALALNFCVIRWRSLKAWVPRDITQQRRFKAQRRADNASQEEGMGDQDPQERKVIQAVAIANLKLQVFVQSGCKITDCATVYYWPVKYTTGGTLCCFC